MAGVPQRLRSEVFSALWTWNLIMKLYWQLLKQWRSSQKKQELTSSPDGFTLLELLVTALISSVVVSGLLYLTNELLTTDQRESNRTETQRNLQTAMDYINTELKQAVYIYENAACVIGDDGAKCSGVDSIINVDNVEGLSDLPGTDPVIPVLAFWKQSPLKEEHSIACAGGSAPDAVPCKSGHAYSLVLYGYSENANADGPWQGEAGIVRYEMGLTPDSLAGTDTEYGKYAAPNEVGLSFPNWPKEDDEAAFGEPQILIDFVDNFRNDDGAGGDGYFSAGRICPTGYFASPNKGGAQAKVLNTVGGFYACVSDEGGSSTESVSTSSSSSSVESYGNQDVIIYMRGNADGRSGLMTEESFLPILESRITVRGALNRGYR